MANDFFFIIWGKAGSGKYGCVQRGVCFVFGWENQGQCTSNKGQWKQLKPFFHERAILVVDRKPFNQAQHIRQFLPSFCLQSKVRESVAELHKEMAVAANSARKTLQIASSATRTLFSRRSSCATKLNGLASSSSSSKKRALSFSR